MQPNSCAPQTVSKLIFSCSGAADVGAIADQAARKLSEASVGRMFCLAGIGGKIPNILEATRAASKILAIDGCPLDCVKQCLQEAGFAKFDHLRLSDLGLEKGKSPATSERIAVVMEKAKAQLAC